MHNIRTYYPSLVATLIMCLVLVFIYPYYQYYVDPDATAYLTISQRYAAGDYDKAVNGYWSPLSCWLTALFIQSGFAVFPAAIIANTIGAVGLIFISQSLFSKFDVKRNLQWVLNGTLAVFLCYAIFKQTFADIWECFLLLASLRIMLSDAYSRNAGLWILNGVVGAIAYFSKAYAFPFFILNTTVCSFIISKAWLKESRMQWIKMSVLAIAAMVVCSMPWIYLLHYKYGSWMTSTAGKLNTSWYLVGHPYWADGIKHLLPPVYGDSPYYWEDPWMANGDIPHFWSSPKLFALQLVRCILNLLKFVQSANEISAFFMVVWLLAVAIVLSKQVRYFFGERSIILATSFLLFPLAFVMVNFEARYIWYMLPISMLIGTLAMQRVLVLTEGYKWLSRLIVSVFAASYIVWPVLDMKAMANVGKAEYEIVQQMKSMGIKGSFTSNASFGNNVQQVARIAYFSGNAYYNSPYPDVPFTEILQEMRRYGIRYYICYGSCSIYDESGRPFPELTEGSIPGLQVFDITR